jgi:hypothetical protein
MPHYEVGQTFDQWDNSNPRAEPSWRSWHKSPIWKSIKRHRLAAEPCCRYCAMEGRTVVASYVDHVRPHSGQWLVFIKYENTQSLCSHHHHVLKQARRSRHN